MAVRYCVHCHSTLADADAEACTACGQVKPSRGWPDDPLLGTTILGRMRLARRLGAGGMGTVYRAQGRDGARFAVKTLHPWLSQSDDMNRRFRREARAASRLSGPHTVRVHEAGELPDGTLFIVMDLVEGESLTDRIERDGWLSARAALRIIGQLAEGLSEAHAAGLVHRDLKPDNVYLTQGVDGDHVKVLDFGIVKYLDAALGTVGHTDTGRVFGTPEYMSPEQARGDEDLDQRSDIFSAGILLFLCLTGRLPWEGADPRASMVRRLTDDAPLISAVRPDLTFAPGLVTLCARMLARDPNHRPADMRDVLAAMRGLELEAPAAREARPTKVVGEAATATTMVHNPPSGEMRTLWALGAGFLVAMAAVALGLSRCDGFTGR